MNLRLSGRLVKEWASVALYAVGALLLLCALNAAVAVGLVLTFGADALPAVTR